MRTYLAALALLLIAGLIGGGVCLAATTNSPNDVTKSARATTPPSDANKNTTTAEPGSGQPEKQPASRTSEGYLGIAIEPLHSTLVEDVERLFGKGQGVLVARVAEGSPAAKAGLQADDVVVTFDDQKIYSPVQLGRLVLNDKPGRETMLGIVRAGECKDIKVRIGDRDDASAARELESLSVERPRRLRTTTEEMDATWSSLDSLILERTGENHFKAAIKYRDNSGKIVSREFQGSIADIRRNVENQRDLPAIERQHLLRALASSERPIELTVERPLAAQVSETNVSRQPEREEVEWTLVF